MLTTLTHSHRPTGWIGRTAAPALLLSLLYAGLRTYWQVVDQPGPMAPKGGDLVLFTGWPAIALCLGTALVAYGLLRRPHGVAAYRLLLVSGAAVSTVLVASGALLLLDVIGFALPGLGIEFFPLGALSRVLCVGTGVLVGAATVAYRRDVRGACAFCGRSDRSPAPMHATPMWAYWAAYVAVSGCVVRILAQAAVGFDESPMSSGVSVAMFEVGFLLAGTALPLALVHGWGRTWPRWVPWLSGRRIPRWLVLGPGVGVSAGIVVYFGLMLMLMIAERVQGRNPFPPSEGLDLPEVFFWFAVPAYLVWGCGMAVAAAVYYLRTRPTCRRCGR